MNIELSVEQTSDNTKVSGRLIILSEINGHFKEGDFEGDFAIGGMTMLVNHADKRQWKVDLLNIIYGIYQHELNLHFSALEILEQHPRNIVPADPQQSYAFQDKHILVAMETYRRQGRYYTVQEIAAIRAEAYKAGFESQT